MEIDLETMLDGRFVGGVNHFRAGVLMLTIARQRDGENFTTGFAAFHDHARIFHGQAGADVAIDPFHFGLLVRETAFGHQIEDVRRPVLDGDVLDLRAFHRHQVRPRRCAKWPY